LSFSSNHLPAQERCLTERVLLSFVSQQQHFSDAIFMFILLLSCISIGICLCWYACIDLLFMDQTVDMSNMFKYLILHDLEMKRYLYPDSDDSTELSKFVSNICISTGKHIPQQRRNLLSTFGYIPLLPYE